MTAPIPPVPPKPPSRLLTQVATARKALTSLVGLGLTYGTLYFGGNPRDAKWIALAVAVSSALGVYSIPNGPKS
jgi:hypothetical protein